MPTGTLVDEVEGREELFDLSRVWRPQPSDSFRLTASICHLFSS